MLKIDAYTQTLVDKLLSTALTKGVQPSDLADALFEKSYREMKISKLNGSINLEISFSDETEEGESLCVMRYIYRTDNTLVRVEQKVNKGKFRVQWDRSMDIEATIAQIKKQLIKYNDYKAVNQWFAELPETVTAELHPKLKLVA